MGKINKYEPEFLLGQGYVEHMMKPDTCPSNDELIAYVENSLSTKRRDEIELHIDCCGSCSAFISALRNESEVTDAQEIWERNVETIDNRVNIFLQKQYAANSARKSSSNWWQLIVDWCEVKNRKLVFATAGIACILMLIVVGWHFQYADQFRLADISVEQTSAYRSSSTPKTKIDQAIRFYESRKFDKANQLLSAEAQANPNRFPVQYYLGLTQLQQAKKNILGLSVGYNQQKVADAKQSLQHALNLTQDNLYFQFDCYWYLGKACIMEGNYKEASEWFNKIAEAPYYVTDRQAEAQKLIHGLSPLIFDTHSK
ncbi:hypothetical protein JW960_04215 [candidate division KSB1 bacterium]|nr:hypothetical protein [candidate division KSB1 bacterium]